MIGSSPATDSNEAASTLVEILVVLAIIGLVTTVSFSYFSPSRNKGTHIAASGILHLAQLARLSAIKQRTSRTVIFDTARGRIETQGSGDRIQLPDGMTMSVLAGQERGATDRTAQILFLSDGSSTGGEIILSAGPAAPSTKIQINWLTGIASIVAVAHEK